MQAIFLNLFYFIFTIYTQFIEAAAIKPRIQWIYFFFSAYLYIHDIWNVLIVTAEVFHLWWYKIWQKMWKEKKVTKKGKGKHSSTFSLFSKWVSVTSVTLWGQILFENVFNIFCYFDLWNVFLNISVHLKDEIFYKVSLENIENMWKLGSLAP